MVDDVYMIAVFIVMILIYAMYCVQKTSNKCSNAFIYPDTSMITDWIPFINYENEDEKKDKKNMDPINDRVNEHYLSSPTYDDMDGMDGRSIVDDIILKMCRKIKQCKKEKKIKTKEAKIRKKLLALKTKKEKKLQIFVKEVLMKR